MLISCVTRTYRRATCLERAIACFLSQDYPGDAELVIFNTDVAHPLRLSLDFTALPKNRSIRRIDQDVDSVTGEPYTNTGAITRDALAHARGTHYVTWDDDDLFWPWDLRQRVDGLTQARRDWSVRTTSTEPPVAWKPKHSWMKRGDLPIELAYNWLEASVLVEIEFVREHGFVAGSGTEHTGWMRAAMDAGRLVEDDDAVPGYAFYWADPPAIAGHKQSGYGANPMPVDNFERHKAGCTDAVLRPIERKRFPEDYPAIVREFRDTMAHLVPTNEAVASYYEPHRLPFEKALAIA